MKVKLLGGGSFYGPYGVMVSYGPNSEIEVDNDDPVSVAYWQERVDADAAEMVEAPPKAAAKAEAAAETDAEAEATGPPPLGGPGSGRDAWADYAASQGVKVTEDMTRDDIVYAVEDKS